MKILLAVFAAVVFTVAATMLLPESDELQKGEIVQTNSIEISNTDNYEHEVIYPENFSSLPRVKIKLTKGSANLEIVEQRTDGFIFKASNLGYNIAEGAHVVWTAAEIHNGN